VFIKNYYREFRQNNLNKEENKRSNLLTIKINAMFSKEIDILIA